MGCVVYVHSVDLARGRVSHGTHLPRRSCSSWRLDSLVVAALHLRMQLIGDVLSGVGIELLLLMQPEEHALILIVLELRNEALLFLALESCVVVAGLLGVLLLADEHLEIIALG